MAYMGASTEVMLGKFNNKSGAKNESIKICVGICKIRPEGQILAFNVLDDVDSDYFKKLIARSITEHLPEIHIHHTHKSRRSTTHNTSATGTAPILAETMTR